MTHLQDILDGLSPGARAALRTLTRARNSYPAGTDEEDFALEAGIDPAELGEDRIHRKRIRSYRELCKAGLATANWMGGPEGSTGGSWNSRSTRYREWWITREGQMALDL